MKATYAEPTTNKVRDHSPCTTKEVKRVAARPHHKG